MYITKVLCILLLSIGVYHADAQTMSYNESDPQIYYSDYETFDFRSGDFDVVGNVGDYTYVYRGGVNGYFLDAYDEQMNRTAKVILDFLPKRVYNKEFITYKDRLVLLYQVYEDGQVKQMGATLNEKGMLIEGPRLIVADKAGVLSPKRGMYEYAISYDKSVIVIYGISTRGEELDMSCFWLDDQLNIQSESNAKFIADNAISYGEAIVDGSGNMFLPAYTAMGSRQYADRLWMLSLSQGGTNFLDAELDLNNGFAAGTYMELDKKEDKIYVGGYYSDKKNGHYIGVRYTYYDTYDKKFAEVKLIPFSDKLLNASGARGKKRAFDDYRIKKLIVKNNGGFVLLAEQFFVTTRSGYTPGFGYYSSYYPTASSAVTEYTYGDVLAISYDGNGQTEWLGFVRKNQYSYDDGGIFSSFGVVNTGGALGIMYNDFNTSNSQVQLASIDGTGRIHAKPVQKKGNKNPDWLPRSGKQVSSRSIVVPCFFKKDIGFAKIVF